MFADVSGSTRLYEQLGDAEALRIINGCLDQLRAAIVKSRGRVIKTIGDEIMASFDTAESAMMAACEIQQRVDGLPPFGEVKLAVRVGFHYGPAILENNDVFGDTVNLAGAAGPVAAISAGDRCARDQGQGTGRACLGSALARRRRSHHEDWHAHGRCTNGRSTDPASRQPKLPP